MAKSSIQLIHSMVLGLILGMVFITFVLTREIYYAQKTLCQKSTLEIK